MPVRCTLVLPCRDEEAALVGVLSGVPDDFDVLVVDNGSSDRTADVARDLGARVVEEPRPGYGAAVHAGMLAANTSVVAVMDADGSMRVSDLFRLLADVESGRATLSVGRRRPAKRGVWPWHARAGNAVVAAWIRRRTATPVHDIAPMRVCRRDDLLDLDVRDRGFGYPVELLLRAGEQQWTITEHDIGYHPRAAGTVSKVSGSVRGSLRAARDFAKVLA